MQLSGNPDEDYQTIHPIIQNVVDNGTVVIINTSPEGYPILEYTMVINGQTVVVDGIQSPNGVFQINDAWVVTK